MEANEIKLRKPSNDPTIWWALGLGTIAIIVGYRYLVGLIQILVPVLVFIFLGLLLPMLAGRTARNEKTQKAKEREIEKWGFCSRDREGPWLNFIDFPLVKDTEIARGKYFYSERLIIHDGRLIINPGPSEVDLKSNKVSYDLEKKRAYAWDGCTPKRYIYWILLIGTPDWWQGDEAVKGIVDGEKVEGWDKFWPKAHHASLVHDALYQYLNSIPIAKKDVDRLFYEMLQESGFKKPIAKIYHLAVRFGGAGDVKEDDPKESSSLKIEVDHPAVLKAELGEAELVQ